MNVIILGGGTAGWLTAFVLGSVVKKCKIKIIESVDVPTIGVGEGSTAIFADLVNGHFFKSNADINEFQKQLEITPKLAIHFKDWNLGEEYYSPVDSTPSIRAMKDKLFLSALSQGKEKVHLSSQSGYCVENNKMFGGAFHFNTNNVGTYFRPLVEKLGVEYETNTIKKVNLDENGFVKSLTGQNGETINGDFFIDATGFAKVLIRELDYNWIDFKNHLPMDSAIPLSIRYEDMSKDDFNDLKAVTTAQAMKAGWQWKIPTTYRVGAGYVYDSTEISDDEAYKEMCEFYNVKEIKSSQNPIKFRSGRLENQWMKNVLAIGLSGAFVEPLQATSIHTTIVQLIMFAQSYIKEDIKETLNEKSIKRFNENVARLYDDMRDFLVLHYTTKREDTSFWKKIKKQEHLTPNVKDILEYCKHSVPDNDTLPHYMGFVGTGLWNWTLAGLGHITPELANKELEFYGIKNEQAYNDYLLNCDINSAKAISFQKFLIDNNPNIKEKFENV